MRLSASHSTCRAARMGMAAVGRALVVALVGVVAVVHHEGHEGQRMLAARGDSW
jgi:hypothetical protein